MAINDHKYQILLAETGRTGMFSDCTVYFIQATLDITTIPQAQGEYSLLIRTVSPADFVGLYKGRLLVGNSNSRQLSQSKILLYFIIG